MASDEERAAGLMGGSVLLAVSRVWSQIASGLLFLATSIAITPSEFGEFAIATSIFGALAVCVGQGTYEYVIKARASENAAPTVFLMNVASATGASLLILLISLITPHLVEGPHIPAILRLLVPVFFLIAVTSLMESVVMKHGNVKAVGRTTIVADTVSLALAMGSLAAGAGVFSLVVQRVVREFVIMTTYGLTERWRLRLHFDAEQAGHALQFARNIVGIRIIGLAATAAVDVTIGAMLGAREAGLYRLVARLLTIGSDILFQPFRASMWVRLPPVQDDVPAFRKANLEMMEVFGLGMFAVMTGVALVAGPLFEMMFKPDWQAAVSLVWIMALGRLLGVPGITAEVVFALRNQMRFLIKFSLVTAILGVAMTLVAAPFGLTVFVVAGVVTGVITQGFMLRALVRCMDMGLGEYMLLFGRLSLNAMCMTAVVAPLLMLEHWLGAPAWLKLATAVPVGAAVYVAAASRFTPASLKTYLDGAVTGYGGLTRLVRRVA